MIKEYAFSLSNRHYFQDTSELGNWMNIDNDTFMSLYDYDDYIVDFFAKKKTLSGFDGLIYMPDEFILDVDGANFKSGRDKTIGLGLLLEDIGIPFVTYFSGTGFHFHIPGQAFRWKPDKYLHLKVKEALHHAGIFEFADPSVTDKTRLIRIPNTKNSKSNLYKVPIEWQWLHDDDGENKITAQAKHPRTLPNYEMECEPIFDALATTKTKDAPQPTFISQGRNPEPVNFPCISHMLMDGSIGKRHAVALRLTSWFRWRYPENIVRLIMEDWRQAVDSPNSKFAEKELDSIVNNCYDGHGGNGYRYGCADPVMDSYCKQTCKLYKSKKNQTVMDASSMEKALIDFLRSDSEPLNLGNIYEDENFPIYPGEVVVIQAPPKSMKTMLLQNWINAFKRPTYFIEMEMSPRQIWSRFVMMEMKWSEGDLAKHYQQMQNGMDKKFDWLTVDYSAPFTTELDKRIQMLPVKPEIVVIDHMGLFKSKHKDPNMKIEEASQAMMELAVRHNIIVFTVSEITKQAFHEGMNMASSKGSFRTAYNTNKLLSVKPLKSRSTGLIEALHLTCEANREREYIDVNLIVDNSNISKGELI